MRNSGAYVSLLMALVAGFALVAGGSGTLDYLLAFNDRAGWGHTVPTLWSKINEYSSTNGTYLE